MSAAIDVLEAVLAKHGHDLESLSPKFEAERLIELLGEQGFEIMPKLEGRRTIKYRPHRGSLEDAMREAVEISDRAHLLRVISKEMELWGVTIEDADIRVEPYSFDERIGWDTHIVTMRNKCIRTGHWFFGESAGPTYFGAIGFTSGPV